MFIKNEEGVTTIEYGLIGVLIAVVIVGILTVMGEDVLTLYGRVADMLTAAAGG